MRPTFPKLLAGLSLLLCAACGGGGNDSTGSLRVVDAATGVTGIDVTAGSQTVVQGLTPGSVSPYVRVNGTQAVTVYQSGNPSSVVSQSVPVAGRSNVTLVVYGRGNALQLSSPLADTVKAQGNGAGLRVGVFASGRFDLYLTGQNGDIATLTPPYTGLTPGTVQLFGATETLFPNVYKVVLANAGTKTVLASATVDLGSQLYQTVLFTDAADGTFSSLTLVDTPKGQTAG